MSTEDAQITIEPVSRPLRLSRTQVTLIEAAVLFALALSIRVFHLDGLPHFDELYHLFAARSWSDEGVLRIADGLYERAWLYTVAQSAWMDLFGHDLPAARLSSAVLGSLTVAAVFLWTRAVAGRTAAWIAALMFCLAPGAILISRFARFYAAQELLLFLGAAGVYALTIRRWPPAATAGLAAGVVLCFGLSLHLQPTTAIGLAGVALWVALQFGGTVMAEPEPRRRWRLWTIAATAAALLGIAAVLAWTSGLAERAWATYRWASIGNSDNRDYFRFYVDALLDQYPTLTTLLPLAAILAVIGRPRAGGLALCIFGTVLVLLSFGGMKEERYIAFAMPWFCILWGIALAQLVPAFRYLAAALDRTVGSAASLAPGAPPRRLITGAVLAGGATVVLLLNPAVPGAVKMLDRGVELTRGGQFAAARARLEPLLTSAAVVIATDDLMALYHLGRYDVVILPSRLSESPNSDRSEFTIDRRTGRPVITTADSLALVLDCTPNGLFVSEERGWRTQIRQIPGAAEVLAARAQPVEVPQWEPFFAYRWDNHGPPPGAACDRLPPGLRPGQQAQPGGTAAIADRVR